MNIIINFGRQVQVILIKVKPGLTAHANGSAMAGEQDRLTLRQIDCRRQSFNFRFDMVIDRNRPPVDRIKTKIPFIDVWLLLRKLDADGRRLISS